MPVEGEYRGSDGFLELFGDPPIIISVERAYGNCPTTQSANDRIQYKTAHLAPLATANLSSFGLQRTYVAARLIRSKTSVGFQIRAFPCCISGTWVHTYAFRS